MYFAVGITLIPNFFLLWSEYGCGVFKLDFINPVDEGIPFIQLTTIATIFLGGSFWQGFNIFSALGYELLLIFIVISTLVTIKTIK